MKSLLVMKAATLCTLSAQSQLDDSLQLSSQSVSLYGQHTESALFVGYTLNRGDSSRKEVYHVIEAGCWLSSYMNRHPANRNIYAASEFVLNSKNFVIGPKVGVYFGALLFCFGSEVICYTDFHDAALRWGFYGGIGLHSFKLTGGLQAKILNTHFEAIHFITVNLSVQVHTLWEEIKPPLL